MDGDADVPCIESSAVWTNGNQLTRADPEPAADIYITTFKQERDKSMMLTHKVQGVRPTYSFLKCLSESHYHCV